ncbi:MAG: lipopolysaccharide transport periplasmic protein LptA [Woeseiaceae bacterium]|nr:lipopolysaccharide transport periplasmic protein LptA [Woeseiaceae bacterium]
MLALDCRSYLKKLRVTFALAALATLLSSGGLWAQSNDLRLPISLDADSTDYDGKSSMLMFRGLKLTQGTIGIEADEGRASKLDFEDSVWQFAGNVVIDTDKGHVECDAADLKFTGHQLRRATITGSPATFESRRPESEEKTVAEAARLTYDFVAGSIEFSGNAVISEGGNKISSEYLVYNIAEQRIQAQSGGDEGSRVKITYTPKEGDVMPDDSAPAGEADGSGPEVTPDGVEATPETGDGTAIPEDPADNDNP